MLQPLSLLTFAEEEAKRLKQFVAWYQIMASKEPEKYPLELSGDNIGLWHEMFAEFDAQNV